VTTRKVKEVARIPEALHAQDDEPEGAAEGCEGDDERGEWVAFPDGIALPLGAARLCDVAVLK
jgi:hypothetical protein